MLKITQLAISGKQVNQKKGSSELHIFTPLCKFLAQNSKYPLLQKFWNFLDIWAVGALQPIKQPSSDMLRKQNSLSRPS